MQSLDHLDITLPSTISIKNQPSSCKMTKELVSLPAEPPVAWTKPTSANTKGGKLYKPTHSELFKVVFEQNEGGDEESFSSKLVALEVSYAFEQQCSSQC
jgi:hypothetical protein